MRGVQYPRIADHQVARGHRHVDFSGQRPVAGRGGRVEVADAVVVGADQVMGGHPAAVRLRQHPQAAVLRPRIGEIPHQKQLVRRRLGAHRIFPPGPILMPVEGGGPGLLGDDRSAPVARPREAQLAQRRPGGRPGDQLGERPILVGEANHAALVAAPLPLLRRAGVEQPVGHPPQARQQAAVQQAREHAESLIQQLPPARARGAHGAHGHSYSRMARPMILPACSAAHASLICSSR